MYSIIQDDIFKAIRLVLCRPILLVIFYKLIAILRRQLCIYYING